jgi:hypothetical protein
MRRFPSEEKSSGVGDRGHVETNYKINSSTEGNKHADPS